ncbi:putative reverse transcriptase zinc-binding domain-containing protein [Helianthus annuus]|nr:putative reverse transcriptase zinc-binding domain-containing protein [Helianthus annuus]
MEETETLQIQDLQVKIQLGVKSHCVIADRIVYSENHLEFSWSWSSPSLSNRDRSDLGVLENQIKEVHLSDQADKRKCSGNIDGSFSTAAIRRLLVEDKGVACDYIMGWVSWVSVKGGIFFWRALLNRIPTRSALVNRNIFIPDSSCCFCGDYEESTDHIFTGCSTATRVWNQFCDWARLPTLFAFGFKDVAKFHLNCNLNKEEKAVVKGLIMIGCWCIWKARNEKIFSNALGRVEDIMGDIKSLGFLWLRNRSKHKSILWADWCKFPMYML